MENKDIAVVKYTKELKKEWNDFVYHSKNSLFMFDRNYMEYHSNRFVDYSLMFYEGDKLIALFPANIVEDEVISHGGLTYGGFILGNDARQHKVNDCLDSLMKKLNKEQIKQLYYKIIPYIYHKYPCEEDRYALFQRGAKLTEVTASTVVNLNAPLLLSHGRKNNISKANKTGVEVREVFTPEDYHAFIDLENEILTKRHGVKAVHSGEELHMLHRSFPQNIHLLCGYLEGEMIAGVVYYEYETVIHTQYMAANEIARKVGALDAVVINIINQYEGRKKWLDFGISTEEHGRVLNEGLIAQKEGFGGRTVVYENWTLEM